MLLSHLQILLRNFIETSNISFIEVVLKGSYLCLYLVHLIHQSYVFLIAKNMLIDLSRKLTLL